MSLSSSISFTGPSIVDGNRQSDTEQEEEKEKEPQTERDSGVLVRILDIPLSLFQRIEESPTTIGPADLQEGSQHQDESSPSQQEEVRACPPLMYQAGELANEVLTIIENDHEDRSWNSQPLHDEGILARVLRFPSSFFGFLEDPLLQHRNNLSSSGEEDAFELGRSRSEDVLDEVLAALGDGYDDETIDQTDPPPQRLQR